MNDCWTRLTLDDQAVDAPAFIAIDFVDAVSPCDGAAGIQMCFSTAITPCSGVTLHGACLDVLFFQIRLLGTQNFYKTEDGQFELRVDLTTNPKVAALHALNPGPGDCTYLFNTFSCPAGCNP